MNRIRSAWSTLTASPRLIAAAAGIVVSAVVVGVGFSLALDGIREERPSGQAASAAPRATDQPTVSPSASPTPTAPMVVATATATSTTTATAKPTPSPVAPTPSPRPTPAVTPPPPPTSSLDGGCHDVTVDQQGTVYVNGEAVEYPYSEEYGEQMPLAVLRLGARAAALSDAEVCLQAELPAVIVSGDIEVCGEVLADRQAPIETPPPAEPGPTMPPTYGPPTIDGVEISDRMLDVNSYPLLDIADVDDVSACLHVHAATNDVWVTLSLAICASSRLGSNGDLTIFVGDQEWSFSPEYVYDEQGALVVGETVSAGLDIRNYLDDVTHLIEMGVWVTPGCPWPDR